MRGLDTSQRGGNEICKRAVEEVMSNIGRGVTLKLVGTPWGMSHDDIENAIRANLREPRYTTPRCQRIRAWNVEKRLAQLQALEILEGGIQQNQ